MHAARNLVDQHAEREHVRAGISPAALQLLGRHVARRADQHARLGHLHGTRVVLRHIGPGEPEIQDLDAPVGRAHDVLGLQIAMDDATGVGRRQRRGDVARRPQDVRGERPRAAGDFLAQRPPVHVLRGDEQVAVVLFERVNGADPWMREPCRSTRFPAQPLPLCGIADQPGCDRLERDVSSQARIGREIDPAHSSPAELPHDGVRTDDASRFVGGFLIVQQRWKPLRHRICEEPADARMVIDERAHFRPDVRIVGDLARQPCVQIGGLFLERLLEDIPHSLPVAAHHRAGDSVSSRNSQARASAQRRFTVATERPSASAVSSLLKPTK